MAHELEIVNGKAQMAYAGDVPWHGLGKKVSNDLTPEQMLEEAGLNWEVEKVPTFAMIGGKKTVIDREVLLRKSDDKILDIVTPEDRKSTRLNSSHSQQSRMPSSA